MLKVWKSIKKLQYGILAKHMMGHDTHDKNIHTRPKVGSCVYALMIIENLGHKTTIKTFWHLKPYKSQGTHSHIKITLKLKCRFFFFKVAGKPSDFRIYIANNSSVLKLRLRSQRSKIFWEFPSWGWDPAKQNISRIFKLRLRPSEAKYFEKF